METLTLLLHSTFGRRLKPLAKLRNSKYGNEEDIAAMLEHFETSTKPTFKDPQDRSYIRFGTMRDKDLDFGIRGGQLALEGYVYVFG